MVKRLLIRHDFSWKRMRKSLKRQRDEELFRLFEKELSLLIEMAEREEIDLYFFDETGFNLNPSVPYGWSKKRKQACLPAIRSKGCTVMGLLNVQKNSFQGNLYDGSANSKCVIQTLDELANSVKRKTVVILDNASIHKSNKVLEKSAEWRAKGLYLQFIPSYSPELNLIEILWRMMKHYWIEFENYSSMDTLKETIVIMLQKYGQDYCITFG